jgi:hypothetical protein
MDLGVASQACIWGRTSCKGSADASINSLGSKRTSAMLETSESTRRFGFAHPILVALLVSGLLSACVAVPESIKRYAAELPTRADGQYAAIRDESVKKSLIVKDALLQCKIDEAEKPDDASSACDCAKSTSPDWTTDCKAWLGNHVPKTTTAPPPAPPETTATPAPAPEASAPATPS